MAETIMPFGLLFTTSIISNWSKTMSMTSTIYTAPSLPVRKHNLLQVTYPMIQTVAGMTIVTATMISGKATMMTSMMPRRSAESAMVMVTATLAVATDIFKVLPQAKKTEIATAATAVATAEAAAETGSYNHKILHKQTDRKPCPFHFLYSFKRKSP